MRAMSHVAADLSPLHPNSGVELDPTHVGCYGLMIL